MWGEEDNVIQLFYSVESILRMYSHWTLRWPLINNAEHGFAQGEIPAKGVWFMSHQSEYSLLDIL